MELFLFWQELNTKSGASIALRVSPNSALADATPSCLMQYLLKSQTVPPISPSRAFVSQCRSLYKSADVAQHVSVGNACPDYVI